MMTFEEFLKKKKIDPVQLQTAEPSLFSEFNSHFSQMGEKSFDHSKKFWFNKLRRSFHLNEEPKPAPVKEVTEVNEIASQAEPLISPTIEATGVPAKFKPRVASAAQAAAPQDKSEQASADSPKPAFKPRFRANLTSPAEAVPESSQAKAEESSEAPAKPAFTPRFKANLTPSQETAQEPDLNKDAEDKPKPAFKPRFNANLTKSASTASSDPVTNKTEPASGSIPEKTADDVSSEPPADKPKPAFKPRFNANLIKSAAVNSETEEVKTEASAIPETPPAPEEKAEESKPETAKPAAYKPRFKPSMVKPKDPEE